MDPEVWEILKDLDKKIDELAERIIALEEEVFNDE